MRIRTSLVWFFLALLTALTMLLCVCAGSITIPLRETLTVFRSVLLRKSIPSSGAVSILLSVRLPRVLCVALAGASLSICGAAMQGLLKNSLADGSTLGVSSGASLGAALSIALNLHFPGLPFSASMIMASLFAFLSLIIILSLAFHLDRSLSTSTIILIGIVYSMFISSILSLVVTLASERLRQITFWTMGSLASGSYHNAAILAAALLVCSVILISLSDALNAFAIGEENARSIGIDVRTARLLVLVTVSVLTGICVSIGGTIAFAGLVTPHMLRLVVGPNHRRLLPACLFGGAVFLMLADLAARVLLRPMELPIGVVTSFIGAILFVTIYYRSIHARHC